MERITEDTCDSTLRARRMMERSARKVDEVTEELPHMIQEAYQSTKQQVQDLSSRVPGLRYATYAAGVVASLPVLGLGVFLAILLVTSVVGAGIIISVIEGGAIVLGSTILLPVLTFVVGMSFLFVAGSALVYAVTIGVRSGGRYVKEFTQQARNQIKSDMERAKRGVEKGLERKGMFVERPFGSPSMQSSTPCELEQ
ncbi:hypothetical protein BZG36_00073 [Bifiguratus adelaidae]|uniref:Uncharacterized protein n=1 Tax=Bifiguratus adelaidae TaxID=1938954 RepID=A0A261Y8J4_9FUNG|nr:hypothetical protein BZG36_00073 [Bifiguratus adelaidae]